MLTIIIPACGSGNSGKGSFGNVSLQKWGNDYATRIHYLYGFGLRNARKSRSRNYFFSGNANATYESPDFVPSLPPPQAITKNCFPLIL